MCDLPSDIAMDGNLGETTAMDTHEAEKVHALHPEPSMGEAVQDTTVAGASQASQSPSQMGYITPVTREMGTTKDSTGVQAIANYMDLR